MGMQAATEQLENLLARVTKKVSSCQLIPMISTTEPGPCLPVEKGKQEAEKLDAELVSLPQVPLQACRSNTADSQVFAMPQHRELPKPIHSSLKSKSARSSTARINVKFGAAKELARVVKIVSHRRDALWHTHLDWGLLVTDAG